ncbi:MAG: saccharopine dehydrogenase NADP-binding domain-containing protein [Myxococcota bacterium]
MLLGATGFTGQLVAEVLARTPGRVRWAIAGRDPIKLRDVKTSLVGISPDNGDVGCIEADTADPASLRAMAEQARVVATTVGPYIEHGLPVVRAAVEAGAHYLDITGEPAFVKASRAQFDDAARAAGVRVVHCCGFDSIPADLGALFTVMQLPPGAPKRVRGYVKVRGTASGGTWASLVDALAGKRPEGAEPRPSRESAPRQARERGPLLHQPPDGVRGVAVPMPVIDPVLVARSARARPDVYGPDFEYQQFLVVRSATRAARLAAGVGALWALSKTRPTRSLLRRWRPSGEGPSAAERANGYFAVTFAGKAGDRRVLTRVSGGDPGYTETSRMFAHAAMLLADASQPLPDAAGVLTPAVAFGEPGIAAMQAAGLKFEVLAPPR